MITVGLYSKTTKISPENEERHFFARLDACEIEEIVETIKHKIGGVEETFDFDKVFSKEVGHYCYVKRNGATGLTPFPTELLSDETSTESSEN